MTIFPLLDIKALIQPEEWIHSVQDLTTPVVLPFDLSSMPLYQGVDELKVGLDSPFVASYRAILKSYSNVPESSSSKSTYEKLLMVLLERLLADKDASSWVMLELLVSKRVAGNDRNAWEVVSFLNSEDHVATIAAINDFWGIAGIESALSSKVRPAFEKICRISSEARMSDYDFFPSNKVLFGQGFVSQSSGLPGYSSLLVDAVPANTLPKSLLLAFKGSPINPDDYSVMIKMAENLPIPTWLWEARLKDYFEKGIEKTIIEIDQEVGPVGCWEEMVAHRWKKVTGISQHDLGILYSFNDIDRLQVTEIEKQELLQMVARLYGKLSFSGWDTDSVRQLNFDCKELFVSLPLGRSDSIGLDCFCRPSDPKEVIDALTESSSKLIAGSILAKISGFDRKIPITVNKLLGVIMNHAPPIPEPERWFCYALVRMGLIARQEAVSRGALSGCATLPQMMEKGSFGNYAADYDPPYPTPQLMAELYEMMPDRHKSVGSKLFLGIELSLDEIRQCNPFERDVQFSGDLGL